MLLPQKLENNTNNCRTAMNEQH